METRPEPQFRDRLDALVPIIALTLDEAADGNALAGLACMSRYHFQRLFRRMMGESPGAFRRRLLLERAAYSLIKTWTAAIFGRKIPDEADNSLDGLIRRLDLAFSEFAGIVRSVRDENRWDESFVDGVCTPPETFTFGGMVSHVVTFSAYRRSIALKIMESLGLTDLGYGDPTEWERSISK